MDVMLIHLQVQCSFVYMMEKYAKPMDATFHGTQKTQTKFARSFQSQMS